MTIACAIVIMITVIMMTMAMISILMITKAWALSPALRAGGVVKKQWRSLALHWAVCN